ncbi:MAG: response regulator [Alphaproteobacteria bacterium]|nr:response regulator [Alphaproteobacteria bacterium]
MQSNSDSRFNILIVDDEPGDIDLVRLALAEGRFLCHTMVAINGKEAMAVLRREAPRFTDAPTPDLVLLDLNMPQMNGREVLRAMKEDPLLANIPVVVLTTSDVERDIVASYDLGASGYIAKPVDMDQLFRAIHSVEEYWFCAVRRPPRN